MLRLDYEELAQSAQKLVNEKDKFNECISAMNTVIEALPDIWEAETCKKYVEQWHELKPGFEETRDLIQDMVDQMNKISQNFKEADTNMAGQI